MLHGTTNLPYITILSDSSGNSYFKETSEALHPAKNGFTSHTIPAQNIFFGKSSDKEQDWHKPDQKLLIIVLSGIMQIETSNNDIKNFAAGDILLIQDLVGYGHKTRSLNGETVKYVAIPLMH